MKIQIHKPLFLNEKGKRDNNEDSIFPLPQKASEQDTLFLVCDGIGGHDKGEVASHLACSSFTDFFQKNQITISTEQDILNAFTYVQQQFDEYIAKEPSIKGFGTTLVLLHIHQNGLTVAHCGDSRFYQIRGNKIIFKTIDHTPVNDLLKQGIITAEEAALRPKTSRISRAIQGNVVQRTKPDIQLISDIQANDYLILCSDGIYGSFSDTDLVNILSSNNFETEKLETIKQLAEANSNDNFSIYIIKIKEIKTGKEHPVFNSISKIANKLFKV